MKIWVSGCTEVTYTEVGDDGIEEGRERAPEATGISGWGLARLGVKCEAEGWGVEPLDDGADRVIVGWEVICRSSGMGGAAIVAVVNRA